jgi:hypothetical protein
MTFPTPPRIEIGYVMEWEIARRVDTAATWANASAPNTNCWYLAHPEGEPTKVEVDGVAYTKKASLANCNAASSSWFYDSATGRLYVQTAGSRSPYNNTDSTAMLSYFLERLASRSPMVYGGKYYLPYLMASSIPAVTFATAGYESSSTQQTFGAIKLANYDGYFDTRLSTYICEAKLITIKAGNISVVNEEIVGDYDDFFVVWMGWSGDISWTPEAVEVSTEDYRRVRV